MSDPIPHFQPMAMSCKCGHQWTGHVPLMVEVSVFIAAVRVIHCPKCGAGPERTYLGHRTPTEGAPDSHPTG